MADSNERSGVFQVSADARRCSRCKVVGKPMLPGQRRCEPCREWERENNRQRRARKRAWEQEYDRARGLRPRSDVLRDLAATREAFASQMVAWAQQHGRVPTLREAGEITGRGAGGYTSGVRIEAFDLGPLPRGPLTIPYPVPLAYRSNAEALRHG